MTELSRRSFFAGLGAILAAPAVVKVVSLIPPLEAARVRSLDYLTVNQITREAVELFVISNQFSANIYNDVFEQSRAKIGDQLRIRMSSDEWRKIA